MSWTSHQQAAKQRVEMTGSDRATVWVLLGPHKGDNNQVLALAEALGMPFRAIECRFRWFGHLPAVCRAATLSPLVPECRSQIGPPWPSLVLGIGQRSAPVARYIQRASGSRTKVVRIGDPMVSPALFDLVITTTQYAVRDASNVIRLPVTITTSDKVNADGVERRWLQQFPRPIRLMVIGGKTSLWDFQPWVISLAAKQLAERATLEGGSVVAVTSPRTSPRLIAAAREVLGGTNVVAGPFPRYGALLAEADEVHVTGDSVSMLSDAIASGKPVGLIKLGPNRLAGFLKLVGWLRGKPLRIRNLVAFWDDLEARGLTGTIQAPRRGRLELSSLDIAVSAVRKLIEVPAAVENVVPLVRPPMDAAVQATGTDA
jgi:mitochondrial fission protein ELM1